MNISRVIVVDPSTLTMLKRIRKTQGAALIGLFSAISLLVYRAHAHLRQRTFDRLPYGDNRYVRRFQKYYNHMYQIVLLNKFIINITGKVCTNEKLISFNKGKELSILYNIINCR